MSHYFSKNQNDVKHQIKVIDFTYKNRQLTFKTDAGVFSKDHVDSASALLLNHVQLVQNQAVLDLGCGYGVIGIALATSTPLELTRVDVNERAIDLAKENAEFNRVDADIFTSEGFDSVTKRFDHIISNPPIRIGKPALYQLFKTAKAHLKSQGSLWLVMHKKHGALSAMTFLETLYKVSLVKRHKGFHVIRCETD